MKRIFIILALAILTPGCGCTTVDTGNRGVQSVYGKVDTETLGEGFHWVSPFASVHDVSVRQVTKECPAEAFSSDIQHMDVKLQVIYRVPDESVVYVFQKLTSGPFEGVIMPRVQEALKEVTATMTSEQIVKSREEVKQKALKLARAKIGDKLIIEDLVIEDLKLSPQLQQAIEAKMVQEQETSKARFVQQKASIDADTAIIRAKGEAEAFRIRGNALRENPKVIEMQMVEKWNGVAPLVAGGSGGSSMILPLDLKLNK